MDQQSQAPVQQGQPAVSKGLLVTFIIVILIGGAFAAWYYLMGPGKKVASSTATTTTTPAATTTTTTTPSTTTTTTTPTTTATADWKTYTNSTNGYSVKYPTKWFLKEDTTDKQVTFNNVSADANYNKSNRPTTYEYLIVSDNDVNCSATVENQDKTGGSDKATVANPTIDNSSVTMKAYQYNSSDGPYIKAYWQNTAGKRFCAFSYMSTTQTVQDDNLSIFKTMLSTFTFTP